jgi:predicted dehydrogenase/threonine dehydrogenase-like Zn-dependent dehydrogenase
MKQIVQNLKNGQTILEELPAPIIGNGQVLIKSTRSLVSLGTEKMLVEFGKANLIQKARQQPERVKQVLDKIKTDGLIPTLETVFAKLDQPLPLGYCNVGRVVGVGKNVSNFKIGDRVASNGSHAEFVCVPENLCAVIPDQVSDDEACFTVISSIGLQGIRLLNPSFGEVHVVYGLGLIGLITVQLLKANGCRVIGIDVDDEKIKLAESFGVICCNSKNEDVVQFVLNETKNIGADGVLITASTQNDNIVSNAAKMSRKRGRIILIGVVSLNLNRSEFYEKELSFQVSCSYGPGRYDEQYEQKGIDYPLPFVRWTEKRNFESILSAILAGQLRVKELISEVVDLDDYENIYSSLGKKSSIASIIKYNESSNYITKLENNKIKFSDTQNEIGIIGAGNFTKMTLLPAMKNIGIKYIVSKNGLSAKELSKKFNIAYSSTNFNDVLADPSVSLAIITTRHNLHADMVVEALKADKHVFVEKPLALNIDQLNSIIETKKERNKFVAVGYNRRFSPHIQKIKNYLPSTSPKNLIAIMNAGFIASNSWVHDVAVGGGRIIGEACHYLDLLAFLSGSPIKSVCMNAMGTNPTIATDNATIMLKFENGDNGVIHYFSNGNKAFPKERLEIYFDEKIIQMNNFQETIAFGIPKFSKLSTRIDKGHQEQFRILSSCIKNKEDYPISFSEILNSTKASFAAIKSMQENAWVNIEE